MRRRRLLLVGPSLYAQKEKGKELSLVCGACILSGAKLRIQGPTLFPLPSPLRIHAYLRKKKAHTRKGQPKGAPFLVCAYKKGSASWLAYAQKAARVGFCMRSLYPKRSKAPHTRTNSFPFAFSA